MPFLSLSFSGDQFAQSRNACRLHVVSAVLDDRPRHRVLDAFGRVEADVALIQPVRIGDANTSCRGCG